MKDAVFLERTIFGIEPVIASLLKQYHLAHNEDYTNMKQNDKKELNMALNFLCVGYLETPDYRSGKKDQTNKVCCEWNGYCSFMSQPMFSIMATAAGFIMLNIISIFVLVFFLMKKKKGARPSGGLDEEEKEVEEFDNDKEEDNDDN